jgi:hypothetical protein
MIGLCKAEEAQLSPIRLYSFRSSAFIGPPVAHMAPDACMWPCSKPATRPPLCRGRIEVGVEAWIWAHRDGRDKLGLQWTCNAATSPCHCHLLTMEKRTEGAPTRFPDEPYLHIPCWTIIHVLCISKEPNESDETEALTQVSAFHDAHALNPQKKKRAPILCMITKRRKSNR